MALAMASVRTVTSKPVQLHQVAAGARVATPVGHSAARKARPALDGPDLHRPYLWEEQSPASTSGRPDDAAALRRPVAGRRPKLPHRSRLTPVHSRVMDAVRRKSLLSTGDRVLVAVSGGQVR